MGRLTGINLGPLSIKFDRDKTAQRKSDRFKAQDIVSKLTRDALKGVNTDSTNNIIRKGIADLESGSDKIINSKRDLGTSTLTTSGLEGANIKGSTTLSDDVLTQAKEDSGGFVDEASKLAVETHIKKLTDFNKNITEKERVVAENIDNVINHPSVGGSVKTILGNENITDTQKVDYIYGLINDLASIKPQSERSKTRLQEADKALNTTLKNKTVQDTFLAFKPAAGGGFQFEASDGSAITFGSDERTPLPGIGMGAYTPDVAASHTYIDNKSLKLDEDYHFLDNTVRVAVPGDPTVIETKDDGTQITSSVEDYIDFDGLTYSALYPKYLRTKYDDNYTVEDFNNDVSQYMKSQIFGGSSADYDDELANTIDEAIGNSMGQQLYDQLASFDANAKIGAYNKYKEDAGVGGGLEALNQIRTKDAERITEDAFFRMYEKEQEEMYRAGSTYSSYMKEHRVASQDKFLRAASSQFSGYRQRFNDILNRYGDDDGSLHDQLSKKLGYDTEEYFEHLLLNGDLSQIQNTLIQIGRFLELGDNENADMIKYIIGDTTTFGNFVKLRDKIYTDDANTINPNISGMKAMFGNFASLNRSLNFSGDEVIFEDVRQEIKGDKKTLLDALYKEVTTNSKLGNLISAVEESYTQSEGNAFTIGGADEVDAQDADVLAGQIAEIDTETSELNASSTEVASVVNALLPDLASAGIDVDTYLEALLEDMKYVARDRAKFKRDIINQLNFDLG